MAMGTRSWLRGSARSPSDSGVSAFVLLGSVRSWLGLAALGLGCSSVVAACTSKEAAPDERREQTQKADGGAPGRESEGTSNDRDRDGTNGSSSDDGQRPSDERTADDRTDDESNGAGTSHDDTDEGPNATDVLPDMNSTGSAATSEQPEPDNDASDDTASEGSSDVDPPDNGEADDGTSISSESGDSADDDDTADDSSGEAGPANTANAPPFDNPLTTPAEGPPAGNPEGSCEVPLDAAPLDTSSPDHVVGTGDSASCTADAFIDAVAQGGVITFDCGPEPVTITLDRPAKVFNDKSERVVIDGGGKVTLSGGGTTRILYMNTCDEAQVFTTPHCQDQEFPQLSIQNLTFTDGKAKDAAEGEGSGGAIFASGGRFKVINSRFFNNICQDTGPDVGGAAIRVLSQFEGRPAYVINTTFGGADGLGNSGSNGGGISSIGVNWTIINSVFSYNRAIGEGGNPAQEGTPGGGSGGAIYNDGGTLELSICGTRIEHNDSRAFGSAIIFVSNNHQGTLRIHQSVVSNNTGGGWDVLPGISMHDDTVRDIDTASIIE